MDIEISKQVDESPVESPSPLRRGVSRRQFLKFAGVVTTSLAIPTILPSDSDQRIVPEGYASISSELWKEPSIEEVDSVITEIEAECSEEFSHETKTYAKNGYQLIDFTTQSGEDESTRSNVVAVLKDGLTAKDAKGVIVYNHSIEGADFDMKEIGAELRKAIEDGYMVVYTLNSVSGVQGTKKEDDDFFMVEIDGKKRSLMDSDRNLANFSSNSPAKNLRGISAVFKEFPELQDKAAEILGFSMGASTTISQLAFWNEFKKKHFLPEIKHVGVYAPASTLFQKEIIADLWKSNGKLGDLGVFSVVRGIMKNEVSRVLTYWEKRITYAVQRRTLIGPQSGIQLPVATNFDESRSMFTDIVLTQEQVDSYMNGRTAGANEDPDNIIYFYDAGDKRTEEEAKLFAETVRFKPKDVNEFADYIEGVRRKYEPRNLRLRSDRELLKVLPKENPDLTASIRRNLVKFSPGILLEGIRRRKTELPVKDITVLRSRMDTIVPPKQTFSLIDQLKASGIKVDEQVSLMGHYVNIEIRSMIRRLRR